MNGNIGSQLKFKLILFICAFGFVLGLGSELYFDKENTTNRLFLKNKAGDVVFEHLNHSEFVKECADCHHELLLFENFIQCNDCHEDDYVFEDYEHDELIEVEEHSCTTCHGVNEDITPKNCRECHPQQKESEETVVSCESCHEDEMSKEDLANHAEFLEIEDHSCDGCHLPQQLSTVYHSLCNRCHLINNEKMFANEDGKSKCERCHLK